MHQPPMTVKIIKLLNGEDIVTILPQGDKQLPDNNPLIRLERPLLIKYVPQMTIAGFKDYIALIKWCAYTPDQIITIPKDKIMTITNASVEMSSSYMNIAKTYAERPVSVRNKNYEQQRLTDEQNEKINELFDEFDEEDMDKTIH